MREQLHNLCASVRKFISGSVSLSHKDDAAFNQLALELFHFQFHNNAPYRKFCEARGKNPHDVRDFHEIPAVPTFAFKELDLTVLPEKARTRVFHSSGTTTQNPSRHFHSAETLIVYETSLNRWFKSFVLPDVDATDFLVLTPPSSDAPHSSLVHMFETVTAQFGANSIFVGFTNSEGRWEIGFEKVLRVLNEIAAKQNKPLIVCGTAFSFVHLCDFLAERGIKLPPGSRVFETGGYKGRSRSMPKEELHAMITDRLGVEDSFIISEYGMSELSSQAYDRKAGQDTRRLFQFPPWTRLEMISPETGQSVTTGTPGLIRIYDLANVGSVMALQTEDLGMQRQSGFELLGRAALAEPRGCSLMPVE